MEQKIFIPFPRLWCCRWERRRRGHPAPARAARGEGGSRRTGTPGPGLAPSRQPGGGSPLPLPSGLGQGGGSTRGGAAPNTRRIGRRRGAVLQRTPRRFQPHGSGRAWSRDGRAGPGAAPRLPPATAAGEMQRGRNCWPPSLSGTPGAGSGVTGRVLGRTQSKAKERKLPTPTVLKSG